MHNIYMWLKMKIRDGSYICFPKSHYNNFFTQIKDIMEEFYSSKKTIKVNNDLILSKIRQKNNLLYLVDIKHMDEYLLVMDNLEKIESIPSNIIKAILIRIRYREKLDGIKKVKLLDDSYLFSFNNKKSFFVNETLEKYYIIIGKEKVEFEALVSRNGARVPILTFNELFLKKIKSKYIQYNLLTSQKILDTVFA